VLAGSLAAGCSAASSANAPTAEPAVTSEKVEGTGLQRLTLSARAAERLGVETSAVKQEQVGGATRLVVPYGALLYDAKGQAWTYENLEGRTFMRHAITVEVIDGDRAVLTEGPTPGQQVVTVGAAELYGVETGVGGGAAELYGVETGVGGGH
jgi:hypothetical protein